MTNIGKDIENYVVISLFYAIPLALIYTILIEIFKEWLKCRGYPLKFAKSLDFFIRSNKSAVGISALGFFGLIYLNSFRNSRDGVADLVILFIILIFSLLSYFILKRIPYVRFLFKTNTWAETALTVWFTILFGVSIFYWASLVILRFVDQPV